METKTKLLPKKKKRERERKSINQRSINAITLTLLNEHKESDAVAEVVVHSPDLGRHTFLSQGELLPLVWRKQGRSQVLGLQEREKQTCQNNQYSAVAHTTRCNVQESAVQLPLHRLITLMA